MNKTVVVLLLAAVAVILAKTMLFSWGIILFLALALAIAAASGHIGKWGYVAAGFCALLAVPGFLFGGFRMIMRMAPLFLLLFGVYWLVKPRGR